MTFEGLEDQVYANLTAASKNAKSFQVYKPDEIPDRWFYKKNRRNIGVFIQSFDGYVFQDAKTLKGILKSYLTYHRPILTENLY